MTRLFKRIAKGDMLLILGLLSMLFPFVILAKFNNPSADDFEAANHTVRAGFWKTQVNNYMGWQGRYFSEALLSVNPLVIRSFFIYKLIPLILFMMLFHALYQLIGELAEGYYQKRKILIAALSLLTLYLFKMSSVAQGFYWYSGSMTYQLANILMVYLCVYIIRLHKLQQIGKMILGTMLCCILVLAIAGLNESSMLLLVLLILSMLIWDVYQKQKVNWVLFTLLIASLIGMYFVVTSPGNSVRIFVEHQPQQSTAFAVKSSIIHSLKNIFYCGTLFPIVGFTVMFIPSAATLAAKRIEQKKEYNIHPVFSFGVFFALLTAGLLPGHKVYFYGPPARTLNIVDLLVVLAWFINVYIFVEYAVKKYKVTLAPLPSYAAVIIYLFIFISFFKEGSNIRTAYIDLLNGRAARYERELKERYTIIAEDHSGSIEVKKLSKPPETIYFNDITSDPKDWLNTIYAEYFHKKSIIVAKSKK